MLELNVTKNTNDQLPGTLGKYYARVEYKKTVGVSELAKHMHQHNAAYSRGLIVGVVADMVDCIKELALEGNVVKIDDLGLFKATVEANGLTLSPGAKVSAGRGSQRTDEELAADISLQQFAVRNVKLLVQATGETTIDQMNGEATTRFTSKAKDTIKSLTGNEANAPANTVADNTGGSGSGTGSGTGSGSGDNGGSSDDPDEN